MISLSLYVLLTAHVLPGPHAQAARCQISRCHISAYSMGKSDNRGRDLVDPGMDPEEKFGHDPRDNLESKDYAADAAWASSTIEAGSVKRLATVNQLQAALEAAG